MLNNLTCTCIYDLHQWAKYKWKYTTDTCSFSWIKPQFLHLNRIKVTVDLNNSEYTRSSELLLFMIPELLSCCYPRRPSFGLSTIQHVWNREFPWTESFIMQTYGYISCQRNICGIYCTKHFPVWCQDVINCYPPKFLTAFTYEEPSINIMSWPKSALWLVKVVSYPDHSNSCHGRGFVCLCVGCVFSHEVDHDYSICRACLHGAYWVKTKRNDGTGDQKQNLKVISDILRNRPWQN